MHDIQKADFKVYQKELTRRKIAYVTLSVSMLIGIFLFSNLMALSVSLFAYLSIGAALLGMGIISFSFFQSEKNIHIRITSEYIERFSDKGTEKFLLDEITKVSLKRRINGMIREIVLTFKNNKHLDVTACEDKFEELKDILYLKLGKNVKQKETREPLDYDHPLFYPVVGLIICFCGVYAYILVFKASIYQLRILAFIFSIYLFGIAVYFFYRKPLSSRAGKGGMMSDLLLGLFMGFGCALFGYFAIILA